jgi:PIN domain nuclease of toxin-antitoxin system
MEPQDIVAEVSAISLSEIAAKHVSGKLNLSMDAVRSGVEDFNLRIVPYTSTHAYTLHSLRLHYRDLFDRMIIPRLWGGHPDSEVRFPVSELS